MTLKSITTSFFRSNPESIALALVAIVILFTMAVDGFGQEKSSVLKGSSQITWSPLSYGSAAPVITIKTGGLTVEPDESTDCTIKSLHKAMRMVVVMGTGNWPHDEWNTDSLRIKWLRAVLANCDKEVNQ